MLTFIKTNYQTGDTIEITCSEGIVTGQIEYVTGQYIVLRQSNGQICGIAATDIRSFRADSPVKMVPANGERAVKAPAYDPEEFAADSATERNGESAEQYSSVATPTLRDVLGEEKEVESADSLTGAAPVAEPKVVGHIDLASIDPNYGRRRYFKSAEDVNGENAASTDNYNNGYQQGNNGYARRSYVRATGRITYYNSLKRFGFIHDFETDSDLYFYVHQIVDEELFNHLTKGTKVVYTIGQNNQGRIATCIHLPRTINELYTMAEDSFDSHQYVVSKGLLEHILLADPDNVDAKQLLGDVEATLPRVGGGERMRGELEPYNPCLLYAQAKKALLSKDYDLAEETYLKALKANEKPESCVKDLLTLYVSRFKQAATGEEKLQIRNKANEFLEAHHSMLLSDSLNTKQFLALNYYLPIQDYDNFLTAVDRLLLDPYVCDSNPRRVFYLWQKAIALNKMGHTDEALKVCDEGLELSPYNRQLNNLRDILLHPEKYQATFRAAEAAQQADFDASAVEQAEAQAEQQAAEAHAESEADTEADTETESETETSVESETETTDDEV